MHNNQLYAQKRKNKRITLKVGMRVGNPHSIGTWITMKKINLYITAEKPFCLSIGGYLNKTI